jgi:hypothetical protein
LLGITERTPQLVSLGTVPALEVSGQRRIRLFLDSNVLRGGIVSPWGLDKATLSLGAAKVCKLVLAEMVRDEVEENLLLEPKSNPARSRPRAPLGNRQQTRLAADAQRQAFHPGGRPVDIITHRDSSRVLPRAFGLFL